MRWSVRSIFGVLILLLAFRSGAVETVVSGTVRSAHVDGATVRLDLADADAPQVVLIVGWLSGFPATPEQYYLGREISARGALRSFRGVREVQVRDVADLTVVSSPTGGDESGAATATEVEKLREQVRTLEQRVQELERGTHGDQ